MYAQDAVLYNSRQRHLVEQPVDLVPHRIRIVNVFFQFEGAFITKSHEFIYPSVFVWTSQQKDVFRVLELQRKQQKDGLETLDTSVNIIAQKDVIDWLNVTIWQFITWRAKRVKKSVKLIDLPMNVSENFDWQFYLCLMKKIRSEELVPHQKFYWAPQKVYQCTPAEWESWDWQSACITESSRKICGLFSAPNFQTISWSDWPVFDVQLATYQ